MSPEQVRLDDGRPNNGGSAMEDAMASTPRPDAGSLILLNPRSFRMSLRDRRRRIHELAERRQARLVEVSEPEEIEQNVLAAMHRGCRLLVVIGGDGTVQAAVTALASCPESQAQPDILVLGGGRTNYTARDIGTHDRLLVTLALALDDPARLSATERRTLALHHPGQARVEHGFFVAGALVDHVIRDCHSYRSGGTGPLRRGHLSSAWRVFQLGLLGLLGRSSYRPVELSVSATELGRLDGACRLLLLTSLHHRREWIDPYARRGTGPVRLTMIKQSASSFWRRLPRLLHGRYQKDMSPESGYLSGNSTEVRIQGLERLSLDGQEIDLDPGQPLTVTAGPIFRFLHP
ncbi:MAG: hypothetical protein JJU31_07555 [Wenzhouxiangella sp.]|nr:hypothetical protein [Wenzhouxiangella sp.]MCH8478524.1 acylglycerol kinase family protein [Wenzhouxiangella sp.]TVR95770.1 MAG: hypothetical protein EA418_06860 [Wenzhouxiangellaceae bacterium]